MRCGRLMTACGAPVRGGCRVRRPLPRSFRLTPRFARGQRIEQVRRVARDSCQPRSDLVGEHQQTRLQLLLTPLERLQPPHHRLCRRAAGLRLAKLQRVLHAPGEPWPRILVQQGCEFSGTLTEEGDAHAQAPPSGLRITVEEAFLHCGRSLIRSRLRDTEAQIDCSCYPTYGQVLADQIRGANAAEIDASEDEANRERL